MPAFVGTCIFFVLLMLWFASAAWRNRRRTSTVIDPSPAIRDAAIATSEAARATGERFHRVRKRRNTELDATFPDVAEEARRKALLS